MDELARELAIETRFPPIALCTDNAAMIAAVADGMLRARRDRAARPRGVLAHPAGARARARHSLCAAELAAHGLAPSQGRGQNFLRRPELASRSSRSCSCARATRRSRSAPALGQLTRAIAGGARRTLALEVDHGLVGAARRGGDLPATVEVRHADALEADFSALVRELGAPVVLVGNLPYTIAGRLLGALLVPNNPFRRMGFMLQREVADRVLAAPDSENYGTLSV